MRIVFCLSGFKKDALRLQPWLTIDQVAQRLLLKGHSAGVITDEPAGGGAENVSIYPVKSLRGYNSGEIIRLLEKINPDVVIVSVTPFSLISAKWYRTLGQYRSFAYISYPFYTMKETFKAFPYLSRTDKISYGRQTLIPDSWWRHKLNEDFRGTICQSERTKSRLITQTGARLPVVVIPPGVTDNWSKTGSCSRDGKDTVFLYVGAPSTIRGFPLVLDALKRAEDGNIYLRVLARGLGPVSVKEIERHVNSLNLTKYVSVRGGWLEKGELQKEISDASTVLMPFALVPSELPVSVLESICCETPVIVSNIDGLPEAVGECGIVVDQCDVQGLVIAMERIHKETGLLDRLRQACRERKGSIKSWDEVSSEWIRTINS